MKKNVMIAVIVFTMLAVGFMYFFQSRNIQGKNGDNLPDHASTADQSVKPTKNETLYDLKSSIGNVIDDSVQEDIQKAVEDEVLKTTKENK